NWNIGSFFGKDFQSHAATSGRNCIRQIGIDAFETAVDRSALQVGEIVQGSPRMNGHYLFVAAEQSHALKCIFEFQAPVSTQFRIHEDKQYRTVSLGLLQSCWLQFCLGTITSTFGGFARCCHLLLMTSQVSKHRSHEG